MREILHAWRDFFSFMWEILHACRESGRNSVQAEDSSQCGRVGSPGYIDQPRHRKPCLSRSAADTPFPEVENSRYIVHWFSN